MTANAIALDYTFLGNFNFSDSGAAGGDVTVQTGTLTATTGAQIGSLVLSPVPGIPGIGISGAVSVTADSILLSGFQPGELTGGIFRPASIFSSLQPETEGAGGDVTVTTGSLSLVGGATIGTSSFGIGNAGNITVTARQSVAIDGAVYTTFDNETHPTGITSELFTGAAGRSGNIAITTPVLKVTNGGTITATSNGTGDAGSITINATESASFDGVVSFASVGQRDRISRAAVIAGTDIVGNGGTLTLTTSNLTLTNGAQLTAQTDGNGNAGNLQVRVQNLLSLDQAGTGILANTSPGSTGNGGSIFIDSAQTVIRNGARIAVDSRGSGVAGNSFLQGRSLVLDNGLISAETVSNTGGNLTLRINDTLAMQGGSRISTSAGTALAGGDGGNITINTRFLATALNGNNDITANAFTGRGGQVNITAQGIFGFLVLSRSQLEAALGTSDPNLLNPAFLPTSNITAISQFNPNLSGQVIIQSPNTDPSRGVVPQPPAIVDASRLIAQDCSATGGVIARQLGSLVVTGQGGLAPSPTDQLRGDSLLIGWENLNGTGQAVQSSAVVQPPRSPVQLVEVQALERQSDGRVVLVAHDPEGSNQEFWSRPITCPTLPTQP